MVDAIRRRDPAEAIRWCAIHVQNAAHTGMSAPLGDR